MRSLLCLSLLFIMGCSTAAKSPQTAPSPAPAAAAPAAKSDAKAAATTGETPAVTCASGGDKRTLTVVAKPPGCELRYSKAGEEKPVASSGTGTQYCEDARTKLRTKLEVAGFSCK